MTGQQSGPGAVRPSGSLPRRGMVPAPVCFDAALVRRWITLAQGTAEATRVLVDSLNLFPVPDSDTGSNVALTLRAAADALEHLPRHADLVQSSRAVADGAVRGARGNSGLLLSQALAAVADVAAEAPDPALLRPVELVHAFEAIASSTWSAVSRPVAGTLLTVAQDAAAAARSALEESGAAHPATAPGIAAAAAFGAQESVVETAGLGHGPVDAGGAALMLLLTSLSDSMTSAPSSGPAGAVDVPGAPLTQVAHQMLADLARGGVAHGGLDNRGAHRDLDPASSGEFEVMYLLEATAGQARELRARLETIGDSVGVVGTPDALGVGLFQVHVHTSTPRAALPLSGRARQVCVHHLHPTALALTPAWEVGEPPQPWGAGTGEDDGRVVSFERLAARRHRRLTQGSAPDSPRRREQASAGTSPLPSGHGRSQGAPEEGLSARVGVIACTHAPGLIEQLARTGAVVVLDPERDGIVRAAGDLGLSEVIVLPCDAASTASAHEAARFLAARSAASSVRGPQGMRPEQENQVVPVPGTHLLVCDTDDETRVLAAVVALTGQGDALTSSELARRAWSVAAQLRTQALDGAAAEPEAVAGAVAEALRPDDELVTLILGRDAPPDVGSLVSAAVARYGQAVTGDPDAVEIVVHAGGQAHPDVLLAIE